MTWFNDSITRLRAVAVTDAYNDAVLDWTTPAELVITGINVQPLSDTEINQADRDSTSTRWRLFTPRGVDIDLLATDRATYNGVLVEVDGEVARWPAADGGLHHVEAFLRKIAG